jgi:hypothetical protein
MGLWAMGSMYMPTVREGAHPPPEREPRERRVTSASETWAAFKVQSESSKRFLRARDTR